MCKDNVESIVYDILSDITGQERDELTEYSQENLFESGIMDSLSLIDFFIRFQEKTGIKFSFSDFKVDDFKCIDTLINVLIEKTIDK